MKKRFIPATVAALALTFSAVAVPQAVAAPVDDQDVAVAQAFDADVVLEQDDTERVTYGELIALIGAEQSDTDTAFEQLKSVEFELPGLTYDYSGSNRNVVAASDLAGGNYVVPVTITYNDETPTVTGELRVTVQDVTEPVITAPDNQTFEVGTAIEPIKIEVNEEATVTVSELPDGLDYNAETGVISGTPTAVTADPVTVTINAKDAAGNEATAVTFTITVGPDVTEPVITAPDNQTFEVGTAIEPIKIEVNEEATVTVSELPDGLDYNAETGVISGTPTAVTAEPATVTINAEDAAGNEATAVTFTITVTEAEDDNGSSLGSAEGSSADDIDWGLVGLGGVLAAVIGVIAAIGGGFIQLPPALANMIPFL